MNLIDQVAHIKDGAKAISEWLGDGGEVVDKETAILRSEMCLACPKHSEVFPMTEMLAAAIRKHLEVKNAALLQVPNEDKLHTCLVCGCAMRLKIWQPISLVRRQMTPKDFENFAVPCWQRDEKP